MKCVTTLLASILAAVCLSSSAWGGFGDALFKFSPNGPQEDRIPVSSLEFGSSLALSENYAVVGAGRGQLFRRRDRSRMGVRREHRRNAADA